MSQGNTCIAEPNLCNNELYFIFTEKKLDNDVRSDDTIRSIITFAIR